MAKIGYARVSTDDQDLRLQLDALREAGCFDVYQEHISGAKAARPALASAMRACRPEDILVVWKLDRLGRSLKNLIEIIEELSERGIAVQTLTGIPVDTSTAHGTLQFQLFAALAEYERALIRERVLAGLAASQARGIKSGRKPRLTSKQQQTVLEMWQADISVKRIADTMRCSRNTIYRALAHAQANQER